MSDFSAESELMVYWGEFGDAFADGHRLSKFYGDGVIAITPAGVPIIAGRDRVSMLSQKVAEFNLGTGMKRQFPHKVEVLSEDSLHVWCRVTWICFYTEAGEMPVPHETSYLLHRKGDELKIMASVAHLKHGSFGVS